MKKFANAAFAPGSEIHSDGYRSYIPALEGFTHEHKPYDPDSGLLHWLHIVISNAKAFILGTYHGLPKKYPRSTSKPISMNTVSVSAAVTLVPVCWNAWPLLLVPLLG